MKQEIKLLELLGYETAAFPFEIPLEHKVLEKWNVVDANGTVVGTIERKKVRDGNRKKTEAIITKIESDTISHHKTRLINNEHYNSLYEIIVKNVDGTEDKVSLSCGEFPNIQIWSEKYPFTQFFLSHNKLFSNFHTELKDCNLEEIVVLEKIKRSDGSYYNKEYFYQVNQFNKEIPFAKYSIGQDGVAGIISVKYDEHHLLYGKEPLTVQTQLWIKKKLEENKIKNVAGTIDEAVVKHELGINAISRIRHQLNERLPFKQEIFSFMLAETPYLDESFGLFFPDIFEKRKDDTINLKLDT